ncbi:MAG: ATP-dependent zinc metalloprotease FtsH, partial [Lysobacterales bacterium]
VTQHKHVSDDTARLIDGEIRTIVESAYATARHLVESHLPQLHLMADALMKYESIGSEQINQIMEGREPDPPEGWNDNETESKASRTDVQEGLSPIGGPAEQV